MPRNRRNHARTAAVYGDNKTADLGRTRSLLTALKKAGKIRNPSAGMWEVVPTKD